MGTNYPPLADVRETLRVEWYRCPIEPAKLREFSRRSDLKGWFQAGGHLVLFACTGVLVYHFWSQQIWLGFAANLVVVAAIWAGGALPAAGFWKGQEAYDQILGAAPRILAASFIAYLIGEFTNAYVLAKMKIATNGRFLWARTIGSTLVGQGLDSTIFIAIAFIGILPTPALVTAIVTQWLFKSAYEACATPVTYGVVNYLKRREGVDVYDRDTKFNPLLIAD